MQGIIAYFTDKITSSASYVYTTLTSYYDVTVDTVNQTQDQVVDNVSTFIESDAGKAAAVLVAETVQGSAQACNPHVPHVILTEAELRRVYFHAAISNLSIVAIVGLYEGLIHPLFKQASNEVTWTEYAVDRAAHLYFVRASIDAFVSSIQALINMSTALNDNVPLNANFAPCEHVKKDQVVGTIANTMSLLYYWGKRGVIAAIKEIPFVGPVIAWPLKAYVAGEALAEVPLAQQCTDDRYEILSRNHAFSFGMGLSVMAATAFFSYLLKALTGLQNKYTDEAIFNMVYLYQMVAAQLISQPFPGRPIPEAELNKPNPQLKPGERDGLDISFYIRRDVDSALSKIASILKPLLSGPTDGDFLQTVNFIVNTKLVSALKTIVLPSGLHSLEGFLQRHDSVVLVDLHAEKARKIIKYISSTRNGKGVHFYEYINQIGAGKYLVSGEVAEVIEKFILHPKLEPMLIRGISLVDNLVNVAHGVSYANQDIVYVTDDSSPVLVETVARFGGAKNSATPTLGLNVETLPPARMGGTINVVKPVETIPAPGVAPVVRPVRMGGSKKRPTELHIVQSMPSLPAVKEVKQTTTTQAATVRPVRFGGTLNRPSIEKLSIFARSEPVMCKAQNETELQKPESEEQLGSEKQVGSPVVQEVTKETVSPLRVSQ